MTSTRQAFTLIELLVVIGVISVLAAIGYGGLINSRGNEGIESVSSLMNNLVRQARHTAMSTGAPVELKITGDSERGFAVQGITQSLIYGQQFDTGSTYGDLITSSNLNLTQSDLTLGHSGNGLPIATLAKWQAKRVRPELIRDESDSFYMECTIQPLLLLGEIITEEIDYIPLLKLNLQRPDPDDNSRNEILLDLGLEPPVDFSTTPPSINNRGLWKIIAGDPDRTGYDIEHSFNLVMDQFTRIGVLYRNQDLFLFINERKAAEFPTTPSFTWQLASAPPYNVPLELEIGSDFSTTNPINLGVIDNVRLMRIGNANAVQFPAFIEPDDNYQLTVFPNGSVIGENASGANWVFRYVGAGESIYRSANISITANGKVNVTKNKK